MNGVEIIIYLFQQAFDESEIGFGETLDVFAIDGDNSFNKPFRRSNHFVPAPFYPIAFRSEYSNL
jgi:hypothetical protein